MGSRLQNYQVLTLIGAIFGIAIVPIILLSFALVVGIFSAFVPSDDPTAEVKALGQMTFISIVLSVIVSIIALVLVFVHKNVKVVGYSLFVLGFISLIATNISGVVTWVLFFVAGIIAVKFKAESENKKDLKGLLRCEYCGMWFERELEKLNHYMYCEKKQNYEKRVN